MSSPAQILANRQNAQRSTGPVTAEGKACIAKNAMKLGLFSVTSFVRPEEQSIFAEFESSYSAELSPATPLEHTLTREIIQAAWRLRRCANLESMPPDNMAYEELERLQISIDRARAAAQRTFHRSLKELRRLQAERACATHIKQASENATGNSAKQTQSAPAPIPRSAPCPCKSGQKYKRCCGKNTPPVLFSAAA